MNLEELASAPLGNASSRTNLVSFEPKSEWLGRDQLLLLCLSPSYPPDSIPSGFIRRLIHCSPAQAP